MSEGNSNIYAEQDKPGQDKNRLEIYNTLILAIATLAITWCSYQSVLWNGIQTFKLADVNKYTRQAQEIMIKVEQHKVMDADLIRGFVQDVWEKKQDKIDFYINRVRPEMTTILQAWVNLNPLENTKAPPHPMAMEEYKKLIQHELDKAEQSAERSLKILQNFNHVDAYRLFEILGDISLQKSTQSPDRVTLQKRAIDQYAQALRIIEQNFSKNSVHTEKITAKIAKINGEES